MALTRLGCAMRWPHGSLLPAETRGPRSVSPLCAPKQARALAAHGTPLDTRSVTSDVRPECFRTGRQELCLGHEVLPFFLGESADPPFQVPRPAPNSQPSACRWAHLRVPADRCP